LNRELEIKLLPRQSRRENVTQKNSAVCSGVSAKSIIAFLYRLGASGITPRERAYFQELLPQDQLNIVPPTTDLVSQIPVLLHLDSNPFREPQGFQI
jgi:hypothetical protein